MEFGFLVIYDPIKQGEMDGGSSKPRRRRKMCNKILVEKLEKKACLARIGVYCILIIQCGVRKYCEGERTRLMCLWVRACSS
jgi:hypothetical protein